MKSKTLKIRNIPKEPPIIATVRVKPTSQLIVLTFIGAIFFMFSEMLSYFGLVIICVCSFCLLVMPDRKLIEFTHDFIIIYNCKDRDDCNILFWEDILTWQYIWRADKDELEIELVNHTKENIECFSKSTIVPLLRAYIKEKEKIPQKGKKVRGQ